MIFIGTKVKTPQTQTAIKLNQSPKSNINRKRTSKFQNAENQEQARSIQQEAQKEKNCINILGFMAFLLK